MALSRRVVTFGLVMVLASGCGSDVKGTLSYEPPIVPISFSIDTNGHIEVKLEEHVDIVTPIGTFSVGAEMSKELRPAQDGMKVVIRTGPDGARQDTGYLIKTHRALRFSLNGSFIEEISQDSVLITVKSGSAALLTVKDAHPELASAKPETNATTCRKDAEHTVRVPAIRVGTSGDSLASVIGKIRAICIQPEVKDWPSTNRAGTVLQVWLPVYKPFSIVQYPPMSLDTGAPHPGDQVVVHSFYTAMILTSTGHGLGS